LNNDKRFIEESFPVKEVSIESAHEKKIRHGHISTLHIWWARRPLASSRATNYAALIPPPKTADEWNKKRNFIIEFSKWENSLNELIKKLASYDCLVIDELGYAEVEPVQVGLFFTLMHKRHKKKTTIITSNLGFQQWSSFLKNDHLTAALIDRLTENSHVINMRKCISLRPKFDHT